MMDSSTTSRSKGVNGTHVTASLDEALSTLSAESRTCIQRLVEYKSPSPIYTLSNVPPHQKLAAVLILLFEQEGSLWVLLTTRSKHLRSHPGQTALPGGKVDPGEKDPFTTARREAFEECGLPLSHPAIQDITLLPPFLSQYKLIVTPCVSLLTDLHVLDTLIPNVGEVDHCFFHPLAAVLDPSVMIEETVADKGSEDWPYEEEHHNTSDRAWLWDSVYRMHRFRSSHTPVKGLTADILLLTAEIAYHRKPVFQRYAPNQVMFDIAVQHIVGGTEPTGDGLERIAGPTVELESRGQEIGNRPQDTILI